MPNRLRFVRRRQVLFGHVSRVNGLIDQNMVPRLVFRGPGQRYFRLHAAAQRHHLDPDPVLPVAFRLA